MVNKNEEKIGTIAFSKEKMEARYQESFYVGHFFMWMTMEK